jgi:hypothetical protein
MLVGRPQTSTRLRNTDCTTLPMSMMMERLPAAGRVGARAELEIRGTVAGPLQVRMKLQFVRGSRGWRFVCPNPDCARTAFTLYFPPESIKPGCRVCLQVVYSSQYEYWSPGALAIRAVVDRMNA